MSPAPNIAQFLVFSGLLGIALIASGCATASKPTAMVAETMSVSNQHAASVSIEVTGGSETSSMGASNISNRDFAEAIRTSISQSGLFTDISSANLADYRLTADIVELNRPMFGTSFTVDLEVTWRLRRTSDTYVVWEKAIASSFTATMGDAFSGATRLRLANEGAARENIREAIQEMAELTLP